jgi:hypothetical protein
MTSELDTLQQNLLVLEELVARLAFVNKELAGSLKVKKED